VRHRFGGRGSAYNVYNQLETKLFASHTAHTGSSHEYTNYGTNIRGFAAYAFGSNHFRAWLFLAVTSCCKCPCAQMHKNGVSDHQSMATSTCLELTNNATFDNHSILCIWKPNDCNSSWDPCISGFEAGKHGQLCQTGTALENTSHYKIINYRHKR
jgi:hypothetical protein